MTSWDLKLVNSEVAQDHLTYLWGDIKHWPCLFVMWPKTLLCLFVRWPKKLPCLFVKPLLVICEMTYVRPHTIYLWGDITPPLFICEVTKDLPYLSVRQLKTSPCLSVKWPKMSPFVSVRLPETSPFLCEVTYIIRPCPAQDITKSWNGNGKRNCERIGSISLKSFTLPL